LNTAPSVVPTNHHPHFDAAADQQFTHGARTALAQALVVVVAATVAASPARSRT
jgi:hypothetical protein